MFQIKKKSKMQLIRITFLLSRNFLMLTVIHNYRLIYIFKHLKYLYQLISMKAVLIILPWLISYIQCSFPKILWLYWSQGISQGSLEELFLKNKQYYLPDWEINLLDSKTGLQWMQKAGVQGYPSHIYYSDGPFRDEYFKSDYLRVCLLRRYGGVWVDFHLTLMTNFDWLQDLSNDRYRISNDFGDEPDIFMFNLPYYDSHQVYYEPLRDKKYELSPGYVIGFWAAKPQTKYLQDIFQKYKEGISKSGYFDIFMSGIADQVIEKQIKTGGMVDQWRMFSVQALHIVMQLKQRQLDEQNKGKQGPRKLAVQYYKIWSMQSVYEIEKIQANFNWNSQQMYQALARKDIEQLRSSNSLPYYTIEIRREIRLQIQTLINPIKSWFSIDKFLSLSKTTSCFKNYEIKQSSFIDKYIFQPSKFEPYFLRKNVTTIECPLSKIIVVAIVTRSIQIILIIASGWLFFKCIFLLTNSLKKLVIVRRQNYQQCDVQEQIQQNQSQQIVSSNA